MAERRLLDEVNKNAQARIVINVTEGQPPNLYEDNELNEKEVLTKRMEKNETGKNNSEDELDQEPPDAAPSTNIFHDQSCSICLEVFYKSQTVIKLEKCEHVFHQKWLDEWMKGNNENSANCPNWRLRFRV